MPWEYTAEVVLDRIPGDADLDEIAGVVRLNFADEELRVSEEYDTYRDLVKRLRRLADAAWAKHAVFEGGVAVLEPTTRSLVQQAIDSYQIEEFFDPVTEPLNAERLVRASDTLSE